MPLLLLLAARALLADAHAADPLAAAPAAVAHGAAIAAVSAAAATAPAGAEVRVAPDARPIRRAPRKDARLRGTLAEDEPFLVLEKLPPTDGCKDGWGRLPGDGFACLDRTTPTDRRPEPLPRLVSFDPPEPSEYETYVATGKYDRSAPERLVPNVYGKPWRKWRGKLYASVAAYEQGAAPIGELPRDRKYHFERYEETSRGTVIVRDDGKVVAVDDVFLYPISRLQGRDLERDPLPEGLWPAVTIAYEGAPVRVAPSEEAEVGVTLPYHTPVVIRSTPADATGQWWEIPDALGPGVPGYVNDWRSIRHPVPMARPDGVGDDELWIDVELSQQVLMAMKGDRMVYFTLIASGDGQWGTPKGTYRIVDKAIVWDMQGRADATYDPYYVEDVPWTMHFAPRYALHGAYWHWGFGRRASHGCVNLAPRDAAWLFHHVGPTLQPGWAVVYETPDDPGTLLRVRYRDVLGPDKRAALE